MTGGRRARKSRRVGIARRSGVVPRWQDGRRDRPGPDRDPRGVLRLPARLAGPAPARARRHRATRRCRGHRGDRHDQRLLAGVRVGARARRRARGLRQGGLGGAEPALPRPRATRDRRRGRAARRRPGAPPALVARRRRLGPARVPGGARALAGAAVAAGRPRPRARRPRPARGHGAAGAERAGAGDRDAGRVADRLAVARRAARGVPAGRGRGGRRDGHLGARPPRRAGRARGRLAGGRRRRRARAR